MHRIYSGHSNGPPDCPLFAKAPRLVERQERRGKAAEGGKKRREEKKKHATIKEKSDETIRDAYRAELVTFERVVQSMANQDADRQSVLGLAPLTQPCVVFGNVVRPGPAHRCIII
jgi:hypothetical protein